MRRDAGTAACQSALAGTFFLLNVALFLELYGDFTRPREPGIGLDPWDFLTLVAQSLLRGRRRSDSVWGVLAELARRDAATAPGAGFHPPRSWRIPEPWLEPFAGVRGPWSWSARGGRLRVVHPAGFVAVAVCDRGDSGALLEHELARYGSPRVRRVDQERPPWTSLSTDHGAPTSQSADWTARLTPHPRPALSRFVGWIAGYIAPRLRLALAARSTDAAVRLTLLLPGMIVVSPARVDVTFALEELPLALRVAGLDRDPGWIPAAGRDLRFHFI